MATSKGITRRATLAGGLAGAGALALGAGRAGVAGDGPDPVWRLADAVAPTGDAAFLWLDAPPRAPRGPAREIVVEIDGRARRIAPATAGLHRLDGLRPGREATIRWRAVGAGGAAPWSQTRRIAPSRGDDFRFSCWADGAVHEPVAEVRRIAADRRGAPTDAPLRLDRDQAGDGRGGELCLAGLGGPLVVGFDHEWNQQAPNPVPPLLRRHFEPLGCFDDLAPCESAEIAYWTEEADGPRERRLVVLGAAGAASMTAMAAVGLDPDGDPVSFRFDRPVPVGRLPDGRPFAVGPLRILRNAGAPVPVDPRARGFEVVANQGAQLCVLARPGILPPPAPILAPDFAPDYVRHAGPYDFAAEGWGEAAAREEVGLALSPSWESLAVYLDSADPSLVRIRFRRVGEARFNPALPLLCDDRDPARFGWRWNPEAADGAGAEEPVDMSAIVRGRHRRTIRHLAPDAEYEVEALQAGRIWRARARTKSYKPRKVSVALGVVEGDVTIRRRGAVVTATRAGLPDLAVAAPPGAHVEFHSGVVRGGAIVVHAGRTILRDVDCWGAPGSAVVLASDEASDLRLVRCRGACWGRATTPETGFATGIGFAEWFNSWLAVPPRTGRGIDGVLVIGAHVGAPRFSANAWDEIDASFLPRIGQARHPDGGNALSIRGPGFLGRGWNVRDSAMWATDDRLYDDGARADANKAFDGGKGCELVYAYNAMGGAADDTLEVEGANVCNLVLGNLLDQTRLRRWTSAPLVALACGAVVWGPLECERNLYRFGAYRGPEPDGPSPRRRVIYKLDRDNDGEGRNGGAVAADVALRGWFVAYHDGAICDPGERPRLSVSGTGHPIVRAIGENNVYVAAEPFRGELFDAQTHENRWGRSNLQYASDADCPALSADGPWWDAAARDVAAAAEPLPNVNDGGPWGAGRRDKGPFAAP